MLTPQHTDDHLISIEQQAVEPLLTPQQTADILQVKVETLATWRYKRRYNLPYRKLGAKCVRYVYADVLEFLKFWMPAHLH